MFLNVPKSSPIEMSIFLKDFQYFCGVKLVWSWCRVQKCQYSQRNFNTFVVSSWCGVGAAPKASQSLQFWSFTKFYKTDGKSRTLSNVDLHNAHFCNIRLVFIGFLKSDKNTFWAASNASQRLQCWSFTINFDRLQNAIKTNGQSRQLSRVDLQHAYFFNIH